jgi:hypothetical protein
MRKGKEGKRCQVVSLERVLYSLVRLVIGYDVSPFVSGKLLLTLYHR